MRMKEKVDVGQFISARRQELGLTQKQLAEQLHVTDKAVSKWERGQGYPDISTLPLLAEVLGVSIDEMLSGSQDSLHDAPVIEVKDMMQTIREVDSQRMERVARWCWLIVTLAGLVAILVCGICNYAIDGGFTWSLYPMASVVFAWLIITPVLLCKRRRIAFGLLVLTFTAVPFLAVILNLAGQSQWLVPLCVPVILISLVFIWVCYFLFAVLKKNFWYSLAIIVLVVAGLDFAIDAIIGAALNEPQVDGWSLLSILICVIAAVVLFAVGKKTKGKVTYISFYRLYREKKKD